MRLSRTLQASVRLLCQLYCLLKRSCMRLLRYLVMNIAKISICCCATLLVAFILLMMFAFAYSIYLTVRYGQASNMPGPLDELNDADEYGQPMEWDSYQQNYRRQRMQRMQRQAALAARRHRWLRSGKKPPGGGRPRLAKSDDFVKEDPIVEVEPAPTGEPEAAAAPANREMPKPIKATNVRPPVHLSRKARDTHSQLKRLETRSKRQCRVSTRGAPVNRFAHIKYRLAERDLCRSEVNLLIVVHSHWSHEERRQLIRSTYGSLNNVRDTIVRLVFTVGLPPESQQRQWLLYESDSYSDIVVGEFADVQSNRMLKDFLALHWAMNFCPTASYVAKLDDSTFVDTVHLATFLRHIPASEFIYCSVVKNQKPPKPALGVRRPRFVPPPGARNFPPHCRAVGFVATSASLAKMLGCSQRLRVLDVDDVFFTGIVAKHASLNLVDFWKGHAHGEMTRRSWMPPATSDFIFLGSSKDVEHGLTWKLAWKLLVVQ